MFKLDNALLEELGLGSLPPEEKNRMLAHIYETLEMRVGMKLAEQMSNEQLDEFESFIDRNDEAGALTWLETNFPDYKDVVAQQLDLLKSEVKASAAQIVAAAAQAAAQAPQQPQVAPQAPQYAQPSQMPSQPGQYQQQPQYPQPPQPQYPQQDQQPPQAA